MSKTLLFGALDWGLGHATRSIPLLSFFEQRGWKLVIAATEGPKKILQEKFPNAQIIEAPAYQITYSKQPSFFIFNLLRQAPRINSVISEERNWVNQMVAHQPIDLILSDNRYGFYHADIPSFILTHQLSPISGWGAIIDNMVRRLHYRLLAPFHQILIPDLKEYPGIAGKLSHPNILPPNAHYIGLLSRFYNLELPKPVDTKLDILILLSGPEPSRSIFEKKMREKLKKFKGTYTLVQGLPNQLDHKEANIIPYADPKTLNNLIQSAAVVICRSGYSSVMDLLALKKKAVLIPTPGQTEQLYIAKHLEEIRLFSMMNQEDVELEKAIEKVNVFDTPHIENAFTHFKKVLEGLINEYEKQSTSFCTTG